VKFPIKSPCYQQRSFLVGRGRSSWSSFVRHSAGSVRVIAERWWPANDKCALACGVSRSHRHRTTDWLQTDCLATPWRADWPARYIAFSERHRAEQSAANVSCQPHRMTDTRKRTFLLSYYFCLLHSESAAATAPAVCCRTSRMPHGSPSRMLLPPGEYKEINTVAVSRW